MGNCCGSSLSDEERAAYAETQTLDQLISRDQMRDSREVKLLLLGTGDSGKSTIFKQMQVLYGGGGFSRAQRDQFRVVVRQNIVQALFSLVQAVRRFQFSFESPEAEAIAASIARLGSTDPRAVPVLEQPDFWSDDIQRYVHVLWGAPAPASVSASPSFSAHSPDSRSSTSMIASPSSVASASALALANASASAGGSSGRCGGDAAVRRAFDQRASFQLDESCVHFFGDVDRICAPSYVPTDQDILRARMKTTGIIENNYSIEGVSFKFLDVGGQRSERRKWIRCFQDVTAIFFLTAVSEIDQTVAEDEQTNRMKESLAVFHDIATKECFERTSIILFLNKIDLLRQKIVTFDLSSVFPEYEGGHDFDAACEFLRDRFVERNGFPNRTVYSHLTCATDTGNVRKVFDDCRRIILQQNLVRNGLIAGPF